MSPNRLAQLNCVALCMAFAGILAAVESFRLGIGTLRNPGPGFLPLISSFFFALSSTWVVLTDRIDYDRWRSLAFIRLIILAAALLGAAWTLESIGFRLMTFMLMSILFYIFGFQRWFLIFVAAAMISVGSDLLFSRLLGLVLPRGPWGL